MLVNQLLALVQCPLPPLIIDPDWVQPLRAELSVLTYAINAGTGASSNQLPVRLTTGLGIAI